MHHAWPKEDNLKNEDDLKNEDYLKNEDNLKKGCGPMDLAPKQC